MTEENRFLKAYEEHKREKDAMRSSGRFECLRGNNYERGRAFYTDIYSGHYEHIGHYERHIHPLMRDPPRKVVDHFPQLPSKSGVPTAHVSVQTILPSPKPATTIVKHTGFVSLSIKNGQIVKAPEIIEVPVSKPAYTCWADILKNN
jgi:hypothetical protein